MRLRDLPIKAVYKTGTDDILRDFYVPALSIATSYDRAVGFYSATALTHAAQGLTRFINRGGAMRLIIGADLAPDEHEAVLRGYEHREAVLSQITTDLFIPVITQVTQELFLSRLSALQWLITHGRLDIRVAFRRRGMYHEKIGIMRDDFGDFVVFQGSANESLHALCPDFNYESINVFRSWHEGEREHYASHIESFERLWEGKVKDTPVMAFPEAARSALLKREFPPRATEGSEPELAEEFGAYTNSPDANEPKIPREFSPFPHQQRSLNAWKTWGQYRGILDLATGAGKTFTAIYGAVRLYQVKRRLALIVAVPFQALADQWIDQLHLFNIKAVLCSSAFPQWKTTFGAAVDAFVRRDQQVIAAVVLNASMQSPDFQRIVKRIPENDIFMFVGDECHHHGARRIYQALPEHAIYRLGLSATYKRYGDEEGSALIEDYYGSVVDRFSLSDAILGGFLTPYDYHLELVSLDEDEARQYRDLSDQIARLWAQAESRENKSSALNPQLQLLLFRRARLLAHCQDKLTRLRGLIDEHGLRPHTLVYCGEGNVRNQDSELEDITPEETRHIDLVTKIISDAGYRVSKFTSHESRDDRQRILEQFRLGAIDVLTAIRCLDEGVDIPACQEAFVLASSRNPRQFIQRRGRILRKSQGKDFAVLWDFLPLLDPDTIAGNVHERRLLQGELSRIREFAENSRNYSETMERLDEIIERYGLLADFLGPTPESTI